MKVKKLPSGWTLIMSLSLECFARIPSDWIEEKIPDEYILRPELNRKRVNEYWGEVIQNEKRKRNN